MNWEERYVKEAFKIKFWERGDNWNKLLKDSPYQNLSEPAPSFTIIEPGYQCELCGAKKHPEDVFRDKNNDNYYCKSHYSLPKVDTFNVKDNSGNIVGKGKDTREISLRVREQTGKLYQLDKKRKEKELKSNQPKEYEKPLEAIFASRYAASKRVHDELTSVLPEGWQIKETRRPTPDEYVRPGKGVEGYMPPGDIRDTSNWDKPRSLRSVTYDDYNPLEETSHMPQTIIAHNPSTGNSLKILSHGAMHTSLTNTDSPRSIANVWGNRFYNPINHGKLINTLLQRVDTRKTGVELDMTANPVFSHFGRGSAGAIGKNRIDFSGPNRIFNLDSPQKPSWWDDKYNFDKAVKSDQESRGAGLDHEMGHLDHNSDLSGKLRPYLSTLIDHHNKLSSNKVDKEQTLSLFDKHINKDASEDGMYEALNSHQGHPLGTAIHNILKTTAPIENEGNDYYQRSLTESYAEHFAAFHNPTKQYVNHDLTHAIAQTAGKKLGW